MTALARPYRSFGAEESAARALLVTTCVAGAAVAWLVTTSRLAAAGTVALLPLVSILAARLWSVVAAIRAPVRTTGAIWILLFASTLVWRGRSTQALNSNPLDRAALIRVGFVVAGGLVATIVLCLPRLHRPRI